MILDDLGVSPFQDTPMADLPDATVPRWCPPLFSSGPSSRVAATVREASGGKNTERSFSRSWSVKIHSVDLGKTSCYF